MPRPACSVVIFSYKKQSAYGAALVDADIDKRFEPLEAVIPEVTLERFSDGDFVKPIEWPNDNTADVISAQNCQVGFTFPLSLELAGLVFAHGLGGYAVTGASAPYTHTYKPMLPCTDGEQLPAMSFIAGFPETGVHTSLLKYTGALPNEFTISADNRSYVNFSGTFITDGKLTNVGSAYSVPAASSAVNFPAGRQVVFSIVDEGGTLVSQASKTLQASFSYNNNLAVDDARALLAHPADSKFLGELKYGMRDMRMNVTLQGHPTNSTITNLWKDYLAGTMKKAQLSFTISESALLTIDLSRCKIINARAGFSGLRDTLELEIAPFYDSVTSAPVVIVVKNAIAAYLINPT